MKDFNDTVAKYSLDDANDYDEYEEEIIERDEYVDEEEEPYDDEYYDEEEEYYDDEEEQYDEEYYDEEEPYDDGYDNQYYDDRFNQVLDELAELKRSIGGTPAVVNQPTPQSPYFISNPITNNNDLTMYNEISRLRDDLNRTQNSHDLHLELGRLKEQMEKEQRQNEAILKNEIRVLNEKLEGNAKHNPQLESGRNTNLLEAGSQASNADLTKLIAINETVMRNSHDSDSKIQSQIADIRKKLAELPDFGALNKNIESIKSQINSKSNNADLISELNEIKTLISSSGNSGAGNDNISGLLDDIKLSLSGKSSDNSEILRQIYELKSILGNSSGSSNDHNAIVLGLYNEFNKVKFDINSLNISLGDKLIAIEKFAKKLAQSSEPEATDIYVSLLTISDGLMASVIDKNTVDSLNSFAAASKAIELSPDTKENVNEYLNIKNEIVKDNAYSDLVLIEDLIAAVNAIEKDKNADIYDSIYVDIQVLAQDLSLAEDNSTARKYESDIIKKLSPLLKLQAKSIADYKPTKPPRIFKTPKLVDQDEALFAKIEDIKTSISDLSIAVMSNNMVADNSSETDAPKVIDMTPVIKEIRALKDQLEDINNNELLSNRIDEIKADYSDIVERLNQIFDNTVALEETVKETAVLTAENNENSQVNNGDPYTISENDVQILDDLNFIREKLVEHDSFITQIVDLRADILSLPVPAETSDINNKLYEDIVGQFDKLYEDLVASSAESNNNNIQKLDDITLTVVDCAAQNTAKLDEVANKITDFENSSSGKLNDLSLAIADIMTSYDKISADIADIKEKVYISVLSDDAENVTDGPKEKSTLLKEISDIRERLATTEELSKEQGEVLIAQTGLLLDQIDSLKETVTIARTEEELNQQMSRSENDELGDNTIGILNEVNDKLTSILYGIPEQGIDNIQIILSDINEIKDKLFTEEEKVFDSDIEKILVDLSYIRNIIENNQDDKNDEVVLNNVTSDELAVIIEDLTHIKDKLSANNEINAEITAIHDEIASANITAKDDVIRELENIHNELSSLKEDLAIINELRGDLSVYRDDLTVYRDEVVSRSTVVSDENRLTSDEVNMLLGEIVSLRDEIQSYKDDINNIVVSTKEETAEVTEVYNAEENINTILDEITNLRADMLTFNEDFITSQTNDFNEIKENVEDLRDIISRRTSIVENESGEINTSNELNVILDEIINLKEVIADVKNELEFIKTEQASSLDVEVQSIKEMLMQLLSEKEEAAAVTETKVNDETITLLYDEVLNLKDQLTSYSETQAINSSDGNEVLFNEITALREEIMLLTEAKSQTAVISEENIVTGGSVGAEGINAILEEIASLRTEIEALKTENKEVVIQENGVSEDTNLLFNEITALREQITLLSENSVQTTAAEENIIENDSGAEGINAILEELAALRAEIEAFKAEKSEISVTEDGVSADTGLLFNELMALREEIVEIKNINATLTTDSAADNDGINMLLEEFEILKTQITDNKPESYDNSALLNEIALLREEIDAIKQISNLNAENDNGYNILNEVSGLRADITSVKDELTALKDEPDLSTINEVMALRDEFQALKDELFKDRITDAEAESAKTVITNDEVVNQVQSLRDQLFAISMANVNDGTSEEMTYESYNNIILDEIASLREELENYKNTETLKNVIEQIAEINAVISANSSNSAISDQLAKLKQDIELLKTMGTSDATNNAILAELANLKVELSNQRDADATSINFMSEMAHLLERQNQYINQVSSTRLTDEMETLKKEIAASLSSASNFEDGTSAIMNEIAKLKEEISLNTGEAGNIENHAILEELAKLKEEISREKDSEENRLILREISRLKDEISSINEKEQRNSNTDKDLSKSIHDLTTELNQIADFVNNEESQTLKTSKSAPKQKPAANKTSSASGGKKTATANKSSGNTKSTASKSAKQTSSGTAAAKKKTPAKIEPFYQGNADDSSNDLLSKIEKESSEFKLFAEDSLSINNTVTDEKLLSETKIGQTVEDMDLASRLARQVANKLIMEQLVQQLGDGGVPKSKVEEIVKDILPQEFTTVAMDEQSDQVRRLANSLVLDKLRARLTGKK